MFGSVFQRPEAGSMTNPQISASSQPRPPLQKLLLRNLPSYGENIGGSPTSSNHSRHSISLLDSGSSSSSPIDRSSMSSPPPLNRTPPLHPNSPERSSPLSKPPSNRDQTSLHSIHRSASSPSPSPTSSSHRSSPRSQTPVATSRSAISLQLDPKQQNLDDWHRYPLVRQLSPIVEQDYVSPDTLRLNVPLPPSEFDTSSTEPPSSSVIRNASVRSDVTRPSPVYSASTAFVSRPLNRSISQTSSRTQRSTGSTPVSAVAPAIPPLDLTPAFPGPHPNNSVRDDGPPPLRPKPISIKYPSYDRRSSDAYSLHADSFITANEQDGDSDEELQMEAMRRFSIRSDEPGPSRWSRYSSIIEPIDETPEPPEVDERSSGHIEGHPIPDVGQRPRPQAPTSEYPSHKSPRITPACWSFWLGFLCPFIWIYGGWWFTLYQETGDDWDAVLPSFACQKANGRRQSFIPPPAKAVHRPREKHVLPLWARSNGNLSDARLGIMSTEEGPLVERLWKGYPFVEKVDDRPTSVHGRFFRALRKLAVFRISLIGPPEWKSRRRLDPWIWRCRVAIFVFMISCVVALTICFAIFIPRTRVKVANN